MLVGAALNAACVVLHTSHASRAAESVCCLNAARPRVLDASRHRSHEPARLARAPHGEVARGVATAPSLPWESATLGAVCRVLLPLLSRGLERNLPQVFATSQMAGPALCPLVGLSCSHTTDMVADCVTLNGQRDATLPRERDSWECL